MRDTMRRVMLPPMALFMLWPLAQLHAQDPKRSGAADPARRAAWQIGAFVGSARNSPNDGALGTIPHRDHFMVGIQAGTPVLRLGVIRVSYLAQLLPLFIVSDRAAPAFNPYLDANGIPRLAQRSYAVGVSPFGLEIASPANLRVSVFAATAGGGLVFTHPFPDVTGRRTNFTLEAGGGVRVRIGAAQWAQLGYKYHHISNAGTAFANPGLDGNVLYAGYQWSVRLPQ
jgi:hypothetical protein